MISFVIPSYKRPNVLVGVLFSLSYQTIIRKYPSEVLISIDEGDPEINQYISYIEQLRKIFKDLQIKIDLHLIINKSKGLVIAKNKAVSKSKYQNIMMLDDDLFMESTYLEGLLGDLDNTDVGAVSGFIVTYKPAISHTQPSAYITKIPQCEHLQQLQTLHSDTEWRSVFGTKEQVMHWGKVRSSLPQEKRYTMDYFVNSYLFKKDIFNKINGYNPLLNSNTSAHEEVDFTFRIKQAGYKLIFNPHHMMWHLTVGSGGIYKGNSWNKSKEILEKEYKESLPKFIDSIIR